MSVSSTAGNAPTVSKRKLECTHCGNSNEDAFEMDEKTADAICTACGFVASRLVYEESEWRDFADEDVSKSRVGAASSIYGTAKLDTHIQGYNKGGDRFAPRGAIARNHAQISGDDPNEHAYFTKIANVADILQFPGETRDMAKQLYLEVRGQLKNSKGKKKRLKRDGLVAALLFIAGKKTGAPRTVAAITATTNIDERDIRVAYSSITRYRPDLARESSTSTVEGIVTRISAQLDVPQNIAQVAINVANAAREHAEGKLPQTVAGASLYLVSSFTESPLKVEKIAEAAGLDKNTIKKLFGELYKIKHVLFPPDHDFTTMIK